MLYLSFFLFKLQIWLHKATRLEDLVSMIVFMYMDCGRTVSTLDLVNIVLVTGKTGDEGREGGLWEIFLREPQPESRNGNNRGLRCVCGDQNQTAPMIHIASETLGRNSLAMPQGQAEGRRAVVVAGQAPRHACGQERKPGWWVFLKSNLDHPGRRKGENRERGI